MESHTIRIINAYSSLVNCGPAFSKFNPSSRRPNKKGRESCNRGPKNFKTCDHSIRTSQRAQKIHQILLEAGSDQVKQVDHKVRLRSLAPMPLNCGEQVRSTAIV